MTQKPTRIQHPAHDDDAAQSHPEFRRDWSDAIERPPAHFIQAILEKKEPGMPPPDPFAVQREYARIKAEMGTPDYKAVQKVAGESGFAVPRVKALPSDEFISPQQETRLPVPEPSEKAPEKKGPSR